MMRSRMRFAKNEKHVIWRILATTPQTPVEKIAIGTLRDLKQNRILGECLVISMNLGLGFTSVGFSCIIRSYFLKILPDHSRAGVFVWSAKAARGDRVCKLIAAPVGGAYSVLGFFR
jgi:hypothetical protein